MSKAHRVKCPECGQMVLTNLSRIQMVQVYRGHCKPGTDPKKSIGCDCAGSYRPVAPTCPVHGDVNMVWASGKEHYHDLKVPHWRCELWVGSGVCGKTIPAKDKQHA